MKTPVHVVALRVVFLVSVLVVVLVALVTCSPGQCVVVNRTDGVLTDIELIGDGLTMVRIDRLAPNETRQVGRPRGEGCSVGFTDDAGRWFARGSVYHFDRGPTDVVIGPGRKVGGQTAERAR